MDPLPTLTDCRCKTIVYGENWGGEIEYCRKHRAAPQLLAVLLHIQERYLTGPLRFAVQVAITPDLYQEIEAAIACAMGDDGGTE